MIRKIYGKLSLNGKILFPFLFVFLGLWTLGTLGLGYFFTQRLEKKLQAETNEVSSVFLQSFQNEKELLFLKARWVADSPEIYRLVTLEEQSTLTRKLLPLQTSFQLDLLKIINTQGKIIAELRQGEITQTKLKDRSVAEAASIGMDLFDLVASESHSPSLLVGLTSVKSSEEILGGVIVGITVNPEFLNKIRAGTQQHLLTFDGSQVTASTLPEATQISWQPYLTQSDLVQVEIADQPYFAKSLDISGLDRTTPHKLVILTPISPLLETQEQIWQTMSLFLFLGGAIAAGVGTLITRLITRRIQCLTQATRNIAKGNFKTIIPLTLPR